MFAKPWTPYQFQLRAVKALIQNPVFGLLMDVGMGKSAITLAALKILKERGIMKRTLVIAPLRACWVTWPGEASKWADFKDLRVVVLHGTKKDEAIQEDADIFVINPEGLEWLMLGDKAKKLGCDTLVVDELHMFKHPNTLRFKLLKYLLPTFKRRWGLTGTPAPNGLLDLFGQIYVLDQGAALGRYITHYRQMFFNQSGYGGYSWMPKADAAEAIYDRLRPIVLRMAAQDYLELPGRVDNFIEVELPPKAMRVYRELELQFLTELENGEILTAPSAAAAWLKLRQVVNGSVYRDSDKRADARCFTEEYANLHDTKLEALEELHEELNGKPLLVAFEFKHDEDRIRRKFKGAVFFSDYRGAKQVELVDAWNRGEISMLVGHPSSMGSSLNLQEACHHIAWYGLPCDLLLYIQFNGRVLRQGNTAQRVFVHHLVARGTVEDAVAKMLRSKCRTQDALFAALKDYAKERK